MSTPCSQKQNPAAAVRRQRLRSRGLIRLEVRVHPEDAPLVRAVARALVDSQRAVPTRALLRGRFAPIPTRSLKDLLSSAPLDGINLERSRDSRYKQARPAI